MTIPRRAALSFAALPVAALTMAVLPFAARGQAGNAAGHGALLIDLAGWEGGERNTVSLSQGAASYMWASREYTRGEARITAILGVSPGAAPDAGGGGQDMEMRSGPNLMRLGTVRGLRVLSQYNEDDKNGGMVIYLTPSGSGGSFVLQFEGITLEEAAALAGQFDWAAMQRQVTAK